MAEVLSLPRRRKASTRKKKRPLVKKKSPCDGKGAGVHEGRKGPAYPDPHHFQKGAQNGERCPFQPKKKKGKEVPIEAPHRGVCFNASGGKAGEDDGGKKDWFLYGVCGHQEKHPEQAKRKSNFL